MPTVLLTGATGLIGSELLRRIVRWDPGTTVAILIRKRGRRTPKERVDELWDELFPASAGAVPPKSRIRILEGDLQAPKLGLDARTYASLVADLSAIYHLGADVRFDLPLEAARAINVEGTLALADLATEAARSGVFERFHHVSTFAASGRLAGRTIVPEAPPVMSRSFRNTYEQSKAEAELALLARSGDMPLTIHRIGIVVGDSRTGWTSKFDVFYMMFRLLVEDLDVGIPYDRVPISGRARVNAMPVDLVADSMFALGALRRGDSGEILHFTPGANASLSADALEAGIEHFARYQAARGRSTTWIPELVRMDDMSPDRVNALLGESYSSEILEMLESLIPYAFDDSVYDNRAFMAAISGTPLRPRPLEEVIGPIVEYPIRSSWGAIPEPRPPLGMRPV
jgi:thioester reductase-like protein